MKRTKQEIGDTFWELLEEKPYNKITVHDIVDRCQVNRNTFYYHFPDIPALVDYTIREWSDHIIATHCRSDAPFDCLEPLIMECLKRKKALFHLYCSAKRERFMTAADEICTYCIRSYIDSVTEDLDISPEGKENIIRYYKCTIIGILFDWMEHNMSYDLLEFTRQICDALAGSGKKALLTFAKDPVLH